MNNKVKDRSIPGPERVSHSRISSKHQITIGKAAFSEAGFNAGDVLAVRAVGPGRVELTTLEALFATHRGRLDTGGAYRALVEQSRDEWQ